MKKKLVVIQGATGVGKTAVAIALSSHYGTEIVSADSRQIYRELSIGTAKPTAREQAMAKHHLIDIASVNDYYNAYMYAEQASLAIENIFSSHDLALVVGGSGLYIDALCSGIDEIPDIDPELRQQVNESFNTGGIEQLRMELKLVDPSYYNEVDLNNHARLIRGIEVFRQTGKPYSSFRVKQAKQNPFNVERITLSRPREELYTRINARVETMMDEGLEREARLFYHARRLNALQTVGYKELFDYFDGTTSLETAVELIKRNTRRYAKKQESWFARDKTATRVDADNVGTIVSIIDKGV